MRDTRRFHGRRATLVFLLYFSIALLIPFSHCAAAEEWCHDITFHAEKTLLGQQAGTHCCDHTSMASNGDIHPSAPHHHHYHFLSEHPLCSNREDHLSPITVQPTALLLPLISLVRPEPQPPVDRVEISQSLCALCSYVTKRASGISPPSGF